LAAAKPIRTGKGFAGVAVATVCTGRVVGGETGGSTDSIGLAGDSGVGEGEAGIGGLAVESFFLTTTPLNRPLTPFLAGAGGFAAGLLADDEAIGREGVVEGPGIAFCVCTCLILFKSTRSVLNHTFGHDEASSLT
jgi:hypothetical protein